MSAVANQGSTFLFQGSDDNFSHLAVRQHLTCLGVHNLDVYVVIPVVHGSLFLAVNGNSRPVHLRKAVNVEQIHSQLSRYPVPHLLAPALGTNNTLFQMDALSNASLGNLLSQQKSIGGRGAQDRGLHIHHHAQLLIRVAGSHGNGHRAQTLRSQLETDSGFPQTITRRNLDTVQVCDARHLIAARKHQSPVIHILLGIGNDDRCSGGA